MNTISTSCITPCGICGAEKAHHIESQDRHGKPLRVVICDNCGVVRNDPIPTTSELSAFYAEGYRQSYKNTREPKLRHAARYFPAVARHIQSHWRQYERTTRLLDIGSGSGEFLYLMRGMGKDCEGLEPTRDYAAFCRERLGLDVTTGEIDRFEPDADYDHIRLCHVVEHLRDPVGDLRKVSNWLRPDGTLYVEVPDFDSYCRTKSPGGMFHYGHIYNFDHDTFGRMVALAGLEIVERTGPTAAFLRKSDQPSAFRPPADGAVSQKAAFYRQHRAGELKAGGRGSRLLVKLRKTIHEHVMILKMPNHFRIAEHVAATLHHKLHGKPVSQPATLLQQDWSVGA